MFLMRLPCIYTVLFLDMRRDVQEIFRTTPHEKQVMMFSATLAKDIRPICKKFMQDVNMSILSSFIHLYYKSASLCLISVVEMVGYYFGSLSHMKGVIIHCSSLVCFFV